MTFAKHRKLNRFNFSLAIAEDFFSFVFSFLFIQNMYEKKRMYSKWYNIAINPAQIKSVGDHSSWWMVIDNLISTLTYFESLMKFSRVGIFLVHWNLIHTIWYQNQNSLDSISRLQITKIVIDNNLFRNFDELVMRIEMSNKMKFDSFSYHRIFRIIRSPPVLLKRWYLSE